MADGQRLIINRCKYMTMAHPVIQRTRTHDGLLDRSCGIGKLGGVQSYAPCDDADAWDFVDSRRPVKRATRVARWPLVLESTPNALLRHVDAL